MIENINVKLDNASGFQVVGHDITQVTRATARTVVEHGAGQVYGKVTFVWVDEDGDRHYTTYRVTPKTVRKVADFVDSKF